MEIPNYDSGKSQNENISIYAKEHISNASMW